MAAGFLPVLPGTNTYVTWGLNMGQTSYNVLMKRPSESANGNGLLAPFDREVWFLILVSMVVVGPILYAIMLIRMKLCQDEDIKMYPLPSCIWFVYGALMKQGSTLSPETDSSRIVFATWWLFILILTAFYTANLTAFLTLSIFTLPINSINDVAKPVNKWFAPEGGAIDYSLKNSDGNLEVLKQSVDRGNGLFLRVEPENVLQRVSQGWLYLDDMDTITRLVFNDYLEKTNNGMEESKRCTFVVSKQEFLIRSVAFAYRNNSVLPLYFDPIIQKLVESGILQHLTSEGLPVSPICPLNLGSKERRLRNSDLLTTYTCVVSGFSCAFCVFMGEIIFRCFKARKYQNVALIKAEHKLKSNKKNNNKGNKVVAFADQIKKNINGREYLMIRVNKGKEQLIPLRTPSTLLFQYV